MSLKVAEIRRSRRMFSVANALLNACLGSVVRQARSKKTASTRSPRACWIAWAAVIGSHSAASAITRSTANPSCSTICEELTCSTERSPLRLCASRRMEFSIAVSPPFALTNMALYSVVLQQLDLDYKKSRQFPTRLLFAFSLVSPRKWNSPHLG